MDFDISIRRELYLSTLMLVFLIDVNSIDRQLSALAPYTNAKNTHKN